MTFTLPPGPAFVFASGRLRSEGMRQTSEKFGKFLLVWQKSHFSGSLHCLGQYPLMFSTYSCPSPVFYPGSRVYIALQYIHLSIVYRVFFGLTETTDFSSSKYRPRAQCTSPFSYCFSWWNQVSSSKELLSASSSPSSMETLSISASTGSSGDGSSFLNLPKNCTPQATISLFFLFIPSLSS